MTGYDAMKSQGSFGENTRGSSRRPQNAADRQDYPHHKRSLTAIDEVFPDVDPRWRHTLATALRFTKRAGQKPTRRNVLARVRAQYGDELCDEFGLPAA